MPLTHLIIPASSLGISSPQVLRDAALKLRARYRAVPATDMRRSAPQTNRLTFRSGLALNQELRFLLRVFPSFAMRRMLGLSVILLRRHRAPLLTSLRFGSAWLLPALA
uniref:Uncharacterized protein n=1 Tax=Nelumbo nucifera TaxID=4432 RepID=A0A822ZIK2_NELNU|nr:TPA_asm: hypothetical protein HUJ06_001535 [Nelumbo nucifera]